MNTLRRKLLAPVAVLALSALFTLAYVSASQAAPPPPLRAPKVVYTIDGAISLANSLAAKNEIQNAGVHNAIVQQLEGAKEKLKDGKKAVAVNKLEATKNLVAAQSGKQITANGATSLTNYLTNLIKAINAQK